MNGFETWASDVRNDRSTNRAKQNVFLNKLQRSFWLHNFE